MRMFDSLFPTIARWQSSYGARWRLSTWWPSDTLDSMQQSLLRLLAVGHRERLELAPLVANLAEEHRGRYRRRLSRLARRLADGTPLVDALEQTPDVLRDEDVLAIRFATQTGTLAPTYQSFLADSAATEDRSSSIRRQTLIYTIVTFIVLTLSVSFLVVFIVPTLRVMHEEFGLVDTHPFFRTFLSVADWVVDHMLLLILAVLAIAFLFWSAPSRRFFRRMLAGRWFHGTVQSRSSQLMQLLSMTVEAGRPVPAAISTLARYHFDRSVRQKLLFARNEIEQGNDVWASLAEANLLTPEESKAISRSSSNQTRAWAMRRMADWKLHRVSNRNGDRLRFLQPIATLLFAAVVLLVGGAMIGFLAQLVQSLAKVI